MKVLIADDHAIMRRGVREILEDSSLDLLVDEAASASQTLKTIREKTYDIVLLDIAFSDGSGLDILQQIHVQYPQTRVLMLSMYPEEQYARRALRMGASGYLTKDSAPAELLMAINKVSQGKKYITQTLVERLADEIGVDVNKNPHELLSDRELQVLIRLGTGRSLQEIATELMLSPKTISTYRSRLLLKLKMKSNADIIRYVLDNKLGG